MRQCGHQRVEFALREHLILNMPKEPACEELPDPELCARAAAVTLLRLGLSAEAIDDLEQLGNSPAGRRFGLEDRRPPLAGPNVCSESIASSDATARSAPSRSALLTTKMSAISMTPALSAWTSSPDPGTSVTIDTSAVRTISISSWPTPTVSTRMMSFPPRRGRALHHWWPARGRQGDRESPCCG